MRLTVALMVMAFCAGWIIRSALATHWHRARWVARWDAVKAVHPAGRWMDGEGDVSHVRVLP